MVLGTLWPEYYREALVDLGRLHWATGNVPEAGRLLRRAADVRDMGALSELGQLRRQADGGAVLERVRRFGLEADGFPSLPW